MMAKITGAILLFLATATPAAAQFQSAVGSGVGSLSGLHWSQWLMTDLLIMGRATLDAQSGEGGNHVGLEVGIEKHLPGFVSIAAGESSAYVAVRQGFQFRSEGSNHIDLAGLGGVRYLIDNTPFEIFMEGGLQLAMAPSVGLRTYSGVGFRYYIK